MESGFLFFLSTGKNFRSEGKIRGIVVVVDRKETAFNALRFETRFVSCFLVFQLAGPSVRVLQLGVVGRRADYAGHCGFRKGPYPIEKIGLVDPFPYVGDRPQGGQVAGFREIHVVGQARCDLGDVEIFAVGGHGESAHVRQAVRVLGFSVTTSTETLREENLHPGDVGDVGFPFPKDPSNCKLCHPVYIRNGVQGQRRFHGLPQMLHPHRAAAAPGNKVLVLDFS